VLDDDDTDTMHITILLSGEKVVLRYRMSVQYLRLKHLSVALHPPKLLEISLECDPERNSRNAYPKLPRSVSTTLRIAVNKWLDKSTVI